MTLILSELSTTRFSDWGSAAVQRLVIAFLASLCTISSAQSLTAAKIVTMKSFSFEPAQLELRAGVPLVLRLQNQSSVGHSFVAPAFFATARVDPASARFVSSGRVEVASRQTIDLALVAAAGTYPLKCGHPFHAVFGMRGVIVVR